MIGEPFIASDELDFKLLMINSGFEIDKNVLIVGLVLVEICLADKIEQLV